MKLRVATIVFSFLVAGALSFASAAPQAAVPVPADKPSGSKREAELAHRAAAILDAFTDSSPVLTRDGKRVVFSSNRDGLPQLYISDTTNPESPARRVVTTTERILAGWPLADGRSLVYRSDRGADENWSIFLCGLDGGGLVELTPGVKMWREMLVIPDGLPPTAFYSARKHSEAASALYSLRLSAGAPEKKLYEEKLPGFLVDVRNDGRRALWVRIPSNTDNTLVLVDPAKGTGKELYPLPGGAKVRVWNARFSPDGKRIYVATDAGGEQALLLALDGSGREIGRYSETHPPTAEISDLLVSKQGNRVALGLGAGTHSAIRLLDAATLQPTVPVDLPLGSGSLGEFSEDGKRLTATWSTPDRPAEIYAVDVATGKGAPLREEPRPSLAGLPKVEASIVEVSAFDGLKLPTNVYLPAGSSGKKLPVIVSYHGGPASSSEIRWSYFNRLFTSLGFAIVEPNVRGSGGFGRAFEMADNGPKRLDAFKDIDSTAHWAAAQPWADSERMVVYGGSYGGYTVLIALERWPDIWRAGVDLFGVANMTTFLQSTSGIIREVFRLEFGDLEKDAAFLKTISPIEDVDKITDPLFVYAGANDPRVPRAESDQIVRALRERKVPVDYMVAENEGHSLARRENIIEFLSRAALFLETELAKPQKTN